MESESQFFKGSLKKSHIPRPKISRTRNGKTIEKSVGMQVELMGKDGELVDVEGSRPLTGTVVPRVDNKPVKGIEKESAEVQMFGQASNETMDAATGQRLAIRNNLEKERPKQPNGRRKK